MSQSGGHDHPYLKFQSQDPTENLLRIQEDLENHLILTQSVETLEAYQRPLLDALSNLLCHREGKINIDFLNLFHRYVYYDQKGLLSINNGQFSDPQKKLRYKITNVVDQGAVGRVYALDPLESHRPPLILKVIALSSDEQKYIQDYLSLEIFKIGQSSQNTWQNNYGVISRMVYDRYYNKIGGDLSTEHLIKTNGDDSLYLSIKSMPFYNEIIINLIIQRIVKDHDGLLDNYLPYYNYFITKVDGQYMGCLLMPMMDGNCANLIDTLEKKWGRDRTKEEAYYLFVDTFMTQITRFLTHLKHPSYLFTHTDMKLENVMYKRFAYPSEEDEPRLIMIDGQQYFCDGSHYYKFYLSDFDKSAISYHGIRFYADYSASHPNQSLLQFVGVGSTQYASTSFLDYGQPLDTSFSIARLRADISYRIQVEVFAMRYIAFPFYLGFDLQSLVMSLFTWGREFSKVFTQMSKTHQKDDSFLMRLLLRLFMENDLADLIAIYSGASWPQITTKKHYGGDFGLLIGRLVVQPKPVRFNKVSYADLVMLCQQDMSVFNREKCRPVNTLLLTPQEHKLVLGFPFVPLVAITKGTWFPTVVYTIDLEKTVDLYKHLHLYNKTAKTLFEPTNTRSDVEKSHRYFVYYNGNVKSEKLIVMTNRYTSTSYLGQRLLYEYDRIDSEMVNEIVYAYEKMFSMIPQGPQTRQRPQIRQGPQGPQRGEFEVLTTSPASTEEELAEFVETHLLPQETQQRQGRQGRQGRQSRQQPQPQPRRQGRQPHDY
jgi:hypothetical protein